MTPLRRIVQRSLAATAAIALLAAAGARAADCPAPAAIHIPPPPPAPLNIDKVKQALLDYHDRTNDNYQNDLAAVYAGAQAYVESRAAQVRNPAVVLDIDETTLTNWPNIRADNFGFIPQGACDDLPRGPCGFDAWILRAEAEAIRPGLIFFNAIRSKGVAVFFITGRRDKQRQATLWNLDRAGYQGYAKLVTRPDGDDSKSIVPFKSGERAKIKQQGFTIIANIGDQLSDLAGETAECAFKLPNPFYFID